MLNGQEYKKNVDTGRKIKKDLREVVKCILKVTPTQWRNIEEQYEACGSRYNYFRKRMKNGK